MTTQTGFTIVTPVSAGGIPHLAPMLNRKGDHVTDGEDIQFTSLRDLHYASFVLFTTDGQDFLLFEGNVDGGRDAFLRELLRTSGAAVDRIYRHCVGYPPGGAADEAAALRYLHHHDIGFGSFYIGWPGHSVEDIRREQHLRDRIEALLDGPSGAELRKLPPRAIHERIVEHVREDPTLRWALTPPSSPFLVRNGSRVLALLVAPLALALVALLRTALRPSADRPRLLARATLSGLAAGAAGLTVALRAAERADDRRDRDRDWQKVYGEWGGHLLRLRHREDVQVQNHMLSVTGIKGGRFRLALLHVVLVVVGLFARLRANQGSLAGIPTIHFARWIITPDRRHLLFMSNYDGSWERYLSDFIDLAADGLTAIWSNTDNDVGFPQTRWLTKKGARDEARFKAVARYSMVPTNIWYSAYPEVTVSNIGNNREIRRGLSSPLDDDAARAWLRRL